MAKARTAKKRDSSADALPSFAKLKLKSHRLVRDSINRIAQLPLDLPIAGARMTIDDEGVCLFFGDPPTKSVDLGFKVVMPTGLGLQVQHLVDAMRSESNQAMTTAVLAVVTGQIFGSGFIQANRNDIADMLDSLMIDMIARSTPVVA